MNTNPNSDGATGLDGEGLAVVAAPAQVTAPPPGGLSAFADTPAPQTPPPPVGQAIARVVADLAAAGGVGKNDRAPELGYAYRGIEALTAALAPLLGRHGLAIVPRYELVAHGPTPGGKLGWTDVLLRAEWTIVGPAGDKLQAVTYGVGRDRTDKGLLKASTAAAKDLLLRLFCVGDRSSDPDAAPPAETAARPSGSTIAEDDAADLAGRLNALGPAARGQWRARFGCPPGGLPAGRLDEGRQLVAELEAGQSPSDTP